MVAGEIQVWGDVEGEAAVGPLGDVEGEAAVGPLGDVDLPFACVTVVMLGDHQEEEDLPLKMEGEVAFALLPSEGELKTFEGEVAVDDFPSVEGGHEVEEVHEGEGHLEGEEVHEGEGHLEGEEVHGGEGHLEEVLPSQSFNGY